jgi:GGDEF domain-containing protein
LLNLALAERGAEQATIFALIEIDGIADVNANLGVLASDELYDAIARRIKKTLPADATCGRIGSNEFAVTLTGGSGFDVETILRAAPQC